MFDLVLVPEARGTSAEVLHKLVEACGLVITVCGTRQPAETMRSIYDAAPRLADDQEVRADGMVLSRLAMYQVFWGVVGFEGGSLALLVPLPEDDGQGDSDWVRYFRTDVLDPVIALSRSGFSTGTGGQGSVTDADFAQAFRRVLV